MIHQFETRLSRLVRELDSIIRDLWDPWDSNDGFQALIDLGECRDKLAELEKDVYSQAMKEERLIRKGRKS